LPALALEDQLPCEERDVLVSVGQFLVPAPGPGVRS
jgi:hypothetical protein